MTLVEIHELLGAGIRAARQRRGWRQEDASWWFRFYGLPTWSPTAVGQVEAGIRKPSIGDLLLAAAALEVSVGDLVPDIDEQIDLGTGATMSARNVRALLTADWAKFSPNPEEFSYPGEQWEAEALRVAGEQRDRLRRFLQPILDRSPRDIPAEEMHQVFLPASEAELHAAGRLSVVPAQLKLASLILWSRGFEQERDARAGVEPGAKPDRSLQAKRGHATRAMLTELQAFLADVLKS